MISTLTSKGRTTIPKRVRERLHLEPGDRLEFVIQDDGTVLMVPATLHIAELVGCLAPPKHRASLAEMDRAIRSRAGRP